MDDSRRKYGAMAFLPLVVFLVIYVGCGITFTLMGAENPFGMFPRHVAILVGIGVALLLAPEIKISEKLDVFCQGMGNSGVMMTILIYLMAGGFQGAAAAMGGKESVINLSLSVLPVSVLIPGVFLMCCLISTAIGTSMGTIAAMAPVAIGVAQGAGLNLAAVSAAVIGGAYFGDNLSMISDTTISAAQGCGSEMRDKFRMNFFIALPAALAALVLYGIVGGGGQGAIQAGPFDVIQVLPYVAVLVTAVMGINVAVVLFLGILLTGVIGLAQGTVGFFTWIQAVGDGMSDMFSISMVAAMISGIIGLVRYYGGAEWLVGAITARIKNRRQAEYGIGLMSGLLSAAMVNNTIGIIVTCPMAKEIGGKYRIAPKRLASLVDIFACAFLAVMPHDGGMLIVTELAGVSPLSVVKYSFYIFGILISTCATIQLGLMRTEEEKRG
ncbi:Na+/H+ antiporter NhaC family protein [Enterocloster lavalensis]|uniref:Na+/H+ antiporter NhaC family protein n=1 Tax=Enterocloster lavalensis TaxID=460384 RepID=UPI001D08B71F|nr:Na+/H+ antiporter NhaC family protein [Enterocloster lavalensis]MCB6343430.1 Na+/H+ antiporter NhaC family protein [Enterocloster lavalensis]